MSEICGTCGKMSNTTLPNAAIQPLLDELAYQNPETLAVALRSGETVLVQCRANVGGLVGTDRRILIVKKGETHEISYASVEEIVIEKVGWFLDAVCQLVTKQAPYQRLKSKAVDASPSALSLIRLYMPTFELAKVRILDIRDSRRCRNCGAFVPIAAGDWVGVERPPLLEPIPNGGAEVLGANLEPGERILCQAHGARFHKSVIVSDRRVMFVQGRAPNRFHAFALAAIDGVEVDGQGVQLRFMDRPFHKLEAGALVGADAGLPADESDVPTLRQVADLVARLKATGVAARGGHGPVTVPESVSMPPHGGTQAVLDVRSPEREAALASLAPEEREQPGTGWAITLFVAAFFMLVVGIWAATQSHAWTALWPLNIVGGLLSYIPFVLWLVYRDRLPNRPLFLWPARVVALILTVAIPLIIWGPVPAPPS